MTTTSTPVASLSYPSAAQPRPRREQPVRWNGWQRHGRMLSYNGYDINLETCTSSAEVLDWIMQIAEKNWGTGPCIAGLVRAFDDLLQPQANLCSGGIDSRLTKAGIRRLLGMAR